ncbi:MAG: helix-turn-helix domain-containing protein [Verrucomicrobiia bacterium]|jgi:hypothetical protein
MAEQEIMAVNQVAEYLYTVYKPVNTGIISSIKIAGQWRFKKDIIDRWITREPLEKITQH